MKKFYFLFISLTIVIRAMAQLPALPEDSIRFDNINKTLNAATSMCVVSFANQAIGAVLILSGLEEFQTKMALGLTLGIGGVGMATNNSILINRACIQIKELKFSQEDSFLRMKMLNNIKSARVLSMIQNITPILGFAAGMINWTLSKPAYPPGEFYTSSLFWIPSISICALGLILIIPEVILIEKTRNSLNTCRQKLILGSTKHGIGISYTFH